MSDKNIILLSIISGLFLSIGLILITNWAWNELKKELITPPHCVCIEEKLCQKN